MQAAIIRRVDGLLAKGREVLASDRKPHPGMRPQVDSQIFAQWKSQSLSFLVDTLGDDHEYTNQFRSVVREQIASHVKSGQGILQAVLEDIKKGYLARLRELVHAEVFADFLEMADHLLAEGYKDPAAVIGGGVLEEHLRQLCRKNCIAIEVETRSGPKPKRADAMNADLAKASVYMVLDQKSVTAWLDLRNKAAHGKYNEYSADQVELFLRGVTDFLARHPA